MLTVTVASKQYTVASGVITHEGEKVGVVEYDNKFGYHPCCKVEYKGRVEWVELDEVGEDFEGIRAALVKLVENKPAEYSEAGFRK